MIILTNKSYIFLIVICVLYFLSYLFVDIYFIVFNDTYNKYEKLIVTVFKFWLR